MSFAFMVVEYHVILSNLLLEILKAIPKFQWTIIRLFKIHTNFRKLYLTTIIPKAAELLTYKEYAQDHCSKHLLTYVAQTVPILSFHTPEQRLPVSNSANTTLCQLLRLSEIP